MNTNTQPPFLGQILPEYPDLCQFVRISGPALAGTTAYPAFVQQYQPDLSMRDREAVYLWEPNGIMLDPGIYDARLIGSYLSLPLFVSNCCPTESSSSA